MGKIKGIVNDEGRTCTVCGEFKMWDEFYDYKRGTRGKEKEQ